MITADVAPRRDPKQTAKPPLVSVVMPAYNAAAYIDEAVNSVLNQTLASLELVVIDDGSSDDTASRLQAIAERDSRLRFFSQTNSGKPALARNAALTQVRGTYVTFLDADDVFAPDHCECLSTTLQENPDCDLVFADIDLSAPDGSVLLAAYNRSQNFPAGYNQGQDQGEDRWLLAQTFLGYQLVHPALLHTNAVMLRQSALVRHGNFDDELLAGEDLSLWFRFIADRPVLYLDRVVSVYRKHDAGLTANGNLIELEGYVAARRQAYRAYPDLLDDAQRRELRARLGEVLAQIGYWLRADRRYPAAIKAHIRGLWLGDRWRNLSGLLKTLARAVFRPPRVVPRSAPPNA